MSARTLLRNVAHTIVQNPDTVTYEAACLSCSWTAVPSQHGDEVDKGCLVHAGRSNHRQFRRVVTGYAFVVRAGEDTVPPAQASPAPTSV